MPRQARIDYPGALHHVMGRGIEGKYIFKKDSDKASFYTRLKEIHMQSNIQIYAWSIMDNHFHILIQTGKTSLAEFMRKLLTGYAINYNRRHKRKGYLFQNRYKSIVCDKDTYLLSLVRYIHLNPVKAKLISYKKLKDYSWTGHKEILGKQEGTIARDEVLGYFGKSEKVAKQEYEQYVQEGIELEEDFNGGGLIRSLGENLETMKTGKDNRQTYDDRILGDGDFVDNVLSWVEEHDEQGCIIKNMNDLLKKLSQFYHIKPETILRKKTKNVKEARNVLIYLAKKYLQINATATGKLVGITQSSASRAMQKGMDIVEHKNLLNKINEEM